MTATVAVLTDSAAALPDELARSRNVTVVRSNLTLGDTTVPDGDLPLDQLLELLPDGVSTSVPTPAQFREAVGTCLDTHERAVVLTVAAEMSTTFDSARLGCEPLADRVRLVDTRTAAGGQALVVLAAARAAADGGDVEEIEAEAVRVAGRVRLMSAVGSLAHLLSKQRGRIPNVIRNAGSRVRVVPLFEFREGRVRPRRPALTREAAFQRIVEACHRDQSPHGRLHVAALHAAHPEDAARLLERATHGQPVEEQFVAPFSTSMIVHTGPDVRGLAWWWEPG